MKLREFNLLNEINQAKALLSSGVLLTERLCRDLTIYLYQVNNFYVEVYFNNIFGMIQGFRGFDSTTALDPYLEEIDISSLQHS